MVFRTCVRAFVRACVSSSVRVPFSLLWSAFTLTDHINALYNESVHQKEQHTSGINTIP